MSGPSESWLVEFRMDARIAVIEQSKQGLLMLRRMRSGIMALGVMLNGPYDTDIVLGDGCSGDSIAMSVLSK